jgi:hypothetical protein
VPSQPIDVANGSYGVWPINLDCDGVKLDYATAQPLCRLQDGNAVWYFLAALDGIPAELSLATDPATVTADSGQIQKLAGHVVVQQIKPGTNRAVSVATANGGSVNFVVLSPAEAKQLYRISFGGKDRVTLTDAAIMPDGANLRLQALDTNDLDLAIFPAGGISTINGGLNGIFTRLTPPKIPVADKLDVTISQAQPAGPNATSLKGMDDATWNDAAVYQIKLPAAAANRRAILKIHYIGDAARIYIGDQLFDDNFYNGSSFSIALWRIPADQWPNIRLKILPYSDALGKRLPAQAADAVAKAKASSTLDKVDAEIVEQHELAISPQ